MPQIVWIVVIVLIAVVVVHACTWWWRRDDRGSPCRRDAAIRGAKAFDFSMKVSPADCSTAKASRSLILQER
jgi:hypothetical protein